MTTTLPLLAAVAAGGAVGAVARWAMSAAALRAFGPGFPWGTLAVNVVGGLLMGLAAALLLERGGGRFAPLLMTGVLGGFTTFSAFSLDAVLLMERGRPGLAALYVGGSVILSVGALWVGLVAGRAWGGNG